MSGRIWTSSKTKNKNKNKNKATEKETNTHAETHDSNDSETPSNSLDKLLDEITAGCDNSVLEEKAGGLKALHDKAMETMELLTKKREDVLERLNIQIKFLDNAIKQIQTKLDNLATETQAFPGRTTTTTTASRYEVRLNW